MEPIGTIESGDEIEYFDESEDELEEKVYSAKDRKETAGVFSEGRESTDRPETVRSEMVRDF